MTPVQREMIRAACQYRSGRIGMFGTRQQTIDSMAAEGLIEKLHTVQGDQRDQIAVQIESLVSKSRELLNAGEWEKALDGLRFASDNKHELDSMSWYVTPKGREAAGVTELQEQRA